MRQSFSRKIFAFVLIFILTFNAMPVGQVYADAPTLISEFEPNPVGTDPANVSFELSGAPGTAFDLWILSVENDGYNGLVDRASNVTGSFDTNGLAVVSIPDLENPTFTVILTDDFTGSTSTDLDPLNNGTLDLSTLGTILDAVGVSDALGDDAVLYGAALGGTDILYNGDEPQLVFRDASVGDFYAIDDNGLPNDVYDASGNLLNAADFDADPTVATFGAINPSLGGPDAPTLISEFEPNPVGTDPANVSFELSGAPGTAFDLWILSVENDGYNGLVDRASHVTGNFDTNGLAVVSIPDLENPTFTVILTDDFTGSTSTDLDPLNNGTLDLSTLGTILDAVGVSDALGDDAVLYGAALGGTDILYNGDEPQLVFRDASVGAFYAIDDNGLPNDVYDASGNLLNAADFDADPTIATFGAINPSYTSPPPVVVTPIYDIQYTTDSSGDSPYKDQSDITTEGVVTAFFYNGYYIEEPAGGAWNGLFVYDYDNNPAVGDYVRLTGTVAEYNNLTEMTSLTAFIKLSSGNTLPDPVVLPTGAVSQEQWESVLVRVEYATVSNDDLGYGEWSVDDGSGDVVIDDKGSYTYIPANGNLLAYVMGVLDYSYGAFKIQPRNDADISLSSCGNSYTPIYTIQGNGAASPLDGTKVDVEGVVVGDFQDGKSGYFIQDATGDGDMTTSDGVFVYGSSPDVNVGDLVRVTGYVDEYYDLTEITGVSDLEVCSTGNSVAATAVSLPIADLEALEGMLVTFTDSLYISEYYNFGRYGEIVLTTDRQFQPTASYDPGSPEAAQMLDDNLALRIKMDDGNSAQNPDPALHPDGTIFDMANLFRGGDILNNVTGVVDYNYGEYKIQPTVGAAHVEANPRTDQPDSVGDGLKVASFNVLNYFTTIDTGDWICGPSGDMECRGADTTEELERQRAKIVAALAAIDADVVGLIEIENNEYEAVADLVASLNDAVGVGTYGYVNTGYIGDDAIKVAFIYKTTTVSLVGEYAILDESVDSRFIDSKNRPALAQTFMDNATGGVFTAVVNHLKSKGSSCDDIGDPDLGDGAGNCNLTRTAAAEALVEWLASDPTNSGDGDFLIMGDLNSYDKEDPIDVLIAGGYSDMVRHYLGENAYSYVFDGQLGYLDHALANDDLAEEMTGVTIWHINADEASLIDYDMSYKKPAQDALYAPDAYRSSDHDPVVIGLDVCDEIAPTLEIELSVESLWPANHKYVDVTATVLATDNFDVAPVVELVSVESSEADEGLGDGDFPNDVDIVDDYTFQLRAERDATSKEGRTYTITYKVTDACGNSTIGTATVYVPFSQKK